MNFWGNFLFQNRVCDFQSRNLPTYPGRNYVRRDEANEKFDMEALRGLDWKLSFQLLRFDKNLGKSLPIDLSDSKIEMNIYRMPNKILDITMAHKLHGDITVSIEFSEAETQEYHRLQSDLEREAYLHRFMVLREDDIKNLIRDQIESLSQTP